MNGLADRWIEMWNEPDDEIRRKTVAELFTENAVYLMFNWDPFVGHDSIFKQVTIAHRIYIPRGFTFLTQHNAQGHHNVVRFSWVMVATDTGDVDMIGNDLLVLADDGRIQTDYQFHDRMSSMAYGELPSPDELIADLGLTDADLARYRRGFLHD